MLYIAAPCSLLSATQTFMPFPSRLPACLPLSVHLALCRAVASGNACRCLMLTLQRHPTRVPCMSHQQPSFPILLPSVASASPFCISPFSGISLFYLTNKSPLDFFLPSCPQVTAVSHAWLFTVKLLVIACAGGQPGMHTPSSLFI